MIIYIFSVLAALGLSGLAAWSDYKGMVIPNYISVLIIAMFFVGYSAVFFAGTEVFLSLKMHMLAAALIFIVTFIMFLLKMIGGGDSKLLTALSLWVGHAGLSALLFYMMVAGLFLGVLALVLKKTKPVKSPKEGSWVARVQAGESVIPYGIPIAMGALAGFIDRGFLSFDHFKLFLM